MRFRNFVGFCSSVHLGYIKRTASVFYATYILRIYPSMRNVECGMLIATFGLAESSVSKLRCKDSKLHSHLSIVFQCINISNLRLYIFIYIRFCEND